MIKSLFTILITAGHVFLGESELKICRKEFAGKFSHLFLSYIGQYNIFKDCVL